MKRLVFGIMLTILLGSLLAFIHFVPVVKSSPDALFFDDFNDGSSDGWTQNLGTWNVANGEYVANVPGTVETGISTVDSIGIADCSIQVNVRFTDDVGFRAEIVFRYADNEHFYTFGISNEYDVGFLGRYSENNPLGDIIADTGGDSSYPVQSNTNYLLRVEIRGNTFKCFINDTEEFSGTDSTFDSGKVGLRTRRAIACFDDFNVSSAEHTITVPDDYPTIQEAINAAWDGDTVFVRNGTYYENIVVSKTVSLVGEAKQATLISGTAYRPTVKIEVSNVTVSGFGIQASSYGVAVSLEMDENITQLDGCILENSMVNGTVKISGDRTNKNVVSGVILHGAITIDVSQEGNTIANNTLDGIAMWQTRNNIITDNLINGMQFFDATYGIYGYESLFYNVIANNIFNFSEGCGILLKRRIEYNSIFGNTFVNNNTNIELGGDYDTDATNNDIFHNNFVKGTNHIILHEDSFGNHWDNGYPSGGNYWSSYNGTDLYLGPAQDHLGSDGIVDTPYLIDANNTDHYPLMSPWTPPNAAALNISSCKTIIGQGSSSNVTVLLENQGNKIEELNASFYANETFIGYQSFMLRSNNSIIYSSDWNLSSLAKGNYSLSVSIATLEGETDLNDNSNNGSWIFITIQGDLNGDKIVDIYDGIIMANHFGFDQYHPSWNPNVDLKENGIIDIFDAIALAKNFGKSWA